MHRARVTAVGNTKAQADGKWLNIIGNKAIAVGDFVWTDGRCVYGNISEGGGVAPVISVNEPYVPIFMKDGTHCLYHKGKLKTGWQDARHELMASRGCSVVFSDAYRVLDVSVGTSGEVQELIHERYSHRNGALGYWFKDYGGSIGAKLGIYFEWEPQDHYWLAGAETEPEQMKYAQVLQEGASLVAEQALVELEKQGPSGEGESMTVLPEKECRITGGWYESEQDYCLFLEGNAQALYMSGRNLGIYDDRERCWQADFGTLYSWEVEYLLEMVATPEGITVLRGRYNNNGSWRLTYLPLDEEYGEPYHFVDSIQSIDLRLPDGFKVTMSRRNKERIEYDGYDEQAYNYELKSPQGQQICEVNGYEPEKRLLACKLRPRTWLVAFDGKLYRVKNGEKKLIEGDCYHCNTRLRPMKDWKNWMKGE